MEFQYLLIVDLDQRRVVDPDSIVSCRALALEHAQHGSRLFLKVLPCMRIREAPQLPVVGQISRSRGDPRFEQKIQIPGLLKIFQVSVAKVAHQSVNVEREPFSDLIPAGTHRSRGHEVVFVE